MQFPRGHFRKLDLSSSEQQEAELVGSVFEQLFQKLAVILTAESTRRD